MYKRIMAIGSLAICVAGMVGTEAMARTCTLRSSSGSCVSWSGSVETLVVTDTQGSLKKHPVVNVKIQPTGDLVIACANGTTLPDISVVLGNFSGFIFGSIAGITKSDISQGRAAVTLSSSLSPDQKTTLTLNGNCPITGGAVVDAVPCVDTTTIGLSNDNGPIDGAVLKCTLPSCETLQWLQDTQHFERREYNCTLP